MKRNLFSRLQFVAVVLLAAISFSSCKKESLSVAPAYIEYNLPVASSFDTITIPAYASHTPLKSVVVMTTALWVDSSFQLSADRDTAGYAITFSREERLESTVFQNGYDSAYKEATYHFDLTENLKTFTTRFLNNDRMIYDSVTTNLGNFQGTDLKFVFSGSVNLGTDEQIYNGTFGIFYLANIVKQSEVITVRYYY